MKKSSRRRRSAPGNTAVTRATPPSHLTVTVAMIQTASLSVRKWTCCH